jgi:hypothetical protein
LADRLILAAGLSEAVKEQLMHFFFVLIAHKMTQQ